MKTKIISTTEMLETLGSFKQDDGSLALLYAMALFATGERDLFSSKEFIMFLEYGMMGNRQAHTAFLAHPLTNWWLSLPPSEVDFQTAFQYATFYTFRNSISEKFSN
jgi:hypothetical protein